MSRSVVANEDEARAELPAQRSHPNRREGRHALPFFELSDDEFEIFCYLLLKREHPLDDIRYFGKTADGGRDIVHRMKSAEGTTVRLIQCKRYESNVPISVVRMDMAKIWVNVFNGTISERPHEIAFYAVPDLTNPARNLLDSQSRWREQASNAIEHHLKATVPDVLARDAMEWWPTPTAEGALSLTERALKHPELVDEFFSVRKVIDGSVDDVAAAVCARILPPVAELGERLDRIGSQPAPLPSEPQEIDAIKAAFANSSAGLLDWPTTLRGGRWLDRPELNELEAAIASEPSSVQVVLGPPGCGKSALLARLGEQMVARGIAVLAIKADQLRSAVDSPGKLAERLSLSLPIDQAVVAVAGNEPVVVILDQLDALADLADLRSERLQVLLNLINRLAGQRGVHVVCSCRAFEFQHDGRLRRLEPHAIHLKLPPWPDVAAVLAANGVAAEGWPDDAKELLRTPHHLAVFLNRLGGPSEHRVFTSYQQLFNDLWQNEVIRRGGGSAELLYDLARRLSGEEELWADRGAFDDRWAAVNELIAAEILCLTDDEYRIGFRHQSLYEFTRAKAFAAGHESLSAYVIRLQDAILVRPTLWMTLNYLRQANPTLYASEFESLWTDPNLRRHVKHLMIDFLSQIERPEPTDRERSILLSALGEPSWRQKVLSAITNKDVWFDRLATTALATEMGKPAEQSQDMIWVLLGSLESRRDTCLKLMETWWRPDDSKHLHMLAVLRYLKIWDERAANLAIVVIDRGIVEHGGMWFLARTIWEDAPPLAVRVVARWIDAARQTILTDPTLEPRARQDKLRGLFEGHSRWHDIQELADLAPVEFARLVLPAFVRAEEHFRSDPSAYRSGYAEGGIYFARLDPREYLQYDRPDHFFLALDTAVRSFAFREPQEFLRTVELIGNPDSAILQRLVCRGLREIAATHPGAAFRFLTTDDRRFWLGNRHDDIVDSLELMTAAAPHLSDEQSGVLSESILAWRLFANEEESDPIDVYGEFARGRRFRLLSAIPSNRWSERVRRFVDQECESLPDHRRGPPTRDSEGPYLIGSPVSREQMESLSETDFLKIFAQFPDATEDQHPTDWRKGGSVQLSHEFEEFAKQHPCRAIVIVESLRSSDQQRPAASAVRGLVAAKHPTSEIFELVHRLDARGFDGIDFRSTVASELGRIARAGGLPDSICELLNRWRVAAAWPTNDETDDERDGNDRAHHPVSILWQSGLTVQIPHGRYSVLAALTYGLLYREPHAADRWLDILADHVERPERTENWQTLCMDLDNVRFCSDAVRRREFLNRLFERFPDVLMCQLGVRFLARVTDALSDEDRRRAYNLVRGWRPARLGMQAYGELLALRHLLHPTDGWAGKQVEAAMQVGTEEVEAVAVGIGFAAANLWTEPTCRHRATELLRRLLALPSERMGYAVMTVFFARDELPLDNATLAIFRQILEFPQALDRPSVDEMFFEHLLNVYPVDTELVCRIAEETVRRRGEDLRSSRGAFFYSSQTLLDLALRLQRSGVRFRSRGMNLFESLLDLGVSEAATLAKVKDMRLVGIAHAFRLPRRVGNAVSGN
jgi:hypothetical protein